MSIREMMDTPVRYPVFSFALILVVLQMGLVFAAFQTGRSRRVKTAGILHLLLSVLLLLLPLLGFEWVLFYPEIEPGIPEALRAYGRLPAVLPAVYEALNAGILVIMHLEMRRYSGDHPTGGSIKETMDLLPAGIAFAQPDGTVVFSNVAMDGLARRLTGKGITDLAAFRKAAAGNAEETAEGSRTEIRDGDRVWQVSTGTLRVDGETFEQIMAADITDEAAISKELAEKNRKLRDIRMRLEIMNRQADRNVIAQELLTARIAVHTEVGNVLLECRRYMKDPESLDETMLLQALKNENMYLLREYEQDDTARDPLADAMETAETIGVEVTLAGIPPETGAARSVLASAIVECATNTVKHAEGNRLRAEIMREKGGAEIRFILESNGNPPREPVRESGGLLSLRTLAEKHGGSMRVVPGPAFRLILTLPAETGE